MRLEPDLLRELLLHIEAHAEEVHSELEQIELPRWSEKQVTYHVVRCEEAGLIEATIDELPDDEDHTLVHVVYSVHSLTFKGHELLGAVREPKHWKVIRDGSKKAGLATVGAIFSFAESYVKARQANISASVQSDGIGAGSKSPGMLAAGPTPPSFSPRPIAEQEVRGHPRRG